jgi:hypothetical protein
MKIQNPEFWRNQPEYSHEQACCLMADIEPPPEKFEGHELSKTRQMAQRLAAEVPYREEVTRNQVARTSGYLSRTQERYQPEPQVQVTKTKHFRREDLKAWAEREGFSPLFLFDPDTEAPPGFPPGEYQGETWSILRRALNEYQGKFGDKRKAPQIGDIKEWVQVDLMGKDLKTEDRAKHRFDRTADVIGNLVAEACGIKK